MQEGHDMCFLVYLFIIWQSQMKYDATPRIQTQTSSKVEHLELIVQILSTNQKSEFFKDYRIK